MLRVQLAVPFPHSLEDLVDQPHVKAAVQVNNLSQLYKSRHKKARDKLLQFLCRRMVRQQRVQGEDHDAAVDCEGMAGLFSTVVRELFEIFAILAAGRLPELFPLRFSVSRVQPRFYLRAKFGISRNCMCSAINFPPARSISFNGTILPHPCLPARTPQSGKLVRLRFSCRNDILYYYAFRKGTSPTCVFSLLWCGLTSRRAR